MSSEKQAKAERHDADTVRLCGGGCDGCPDAHFLGNGSVLLEDMGQVVLITAPQLAEFILACSKRGLVPPCPAGSSS